MTSCELFLSIMGGQNEKKEESLGCPVVGKRKCELISVYFFFTFFFFGYFDIFIFCLKIIYGLALFCRFYYLWNLDILH